MGNISQKNLEKLPLCPKKLKAIIESGDPKYVIVDVRNERQYKKGHIPTAINIFDGKTSIMKNPPEKNKFTNLNNVVTYDEILDEHYNNALQIIQNNYHRTKKSIYHPKIDNFKPYFIGNYDKCLFSFYQENTIITENETTLIPDVNNIAFISSRPLRAIIDNNKINLYYVDYLCVEKKHTKSGIAPELIQTHVYNSWKKKF